MGRERTCSASDCPRVAVVRNLCRYHYNLAWMTTRTKTCSIDGCDDLLLAREWCEKHYNRWRKHGDVFRERPTLENRFWSKVVKTETCWLWVAKTDKHGYGRMQTGTFKNSVSKLAHRLAYEFAIGPIPKGLTLDHLCVNPSCVNPAHLEPVTQSVNSKRLAARRAALKQAGTCPSCLQQLPAPRI